MPRPKPAEEPVQIVVRIAPSLLAKVDFEAEASGRSRNAVLADAAEAHVALKAGFRAMQKLGEGWAAQQARSAAAKLAAVQLGPSSSAPGSRLKTSQKGPKR